MKTLTLPKQGVNLCPLGSDEEIDEDSPFEYDQLIQTVEAVLGQAILKALPPSKTKAPSKPKSAPPQASKPSAKQPAQHTGKKKELPPALPEDGPLLEDASQVFLMEDTHS